MGDYDKGNISFCHTNQSQAHTSFVIMIPKIFLSFLASSLVFAHPGEDHDHVKREAEELNVFSKRSLDLLSRCADSLSARALQEKNLVRRTAIAKALLKERNLDCKKSTFYTYATSFNIC
jgi:hypothetical protein